MVIGIQSDVLYPDCRTGIFAKNNTRMLNLLSIASDFGHDGFLLEYEKIETALKKFIEDQIIPSFKSSE